MSRRRKPRTPANTIAPNDGTKWGHLSDAELFAELARRRMAAGPVSLEDIELQSEALGHAAGEEIQAATIEALPPEGSAPKPCPKCSRLVPVKTHNRVRRLLTVAGELRLSRNYHYCKSCRHGFYPRDAELKLPEEGEVSDAMERRILDFGINDTFESSAQRFSIHFPSAPISSNLVRRVVDRVGRRSARASTEQALQEACRQAPEEPPRSLVVAGDGSMLLTREDGWRETKVAVVARSEDIIEMKNARRAVSDARYVAVLGDKDEFRASLDAALKAERADEATQVAWLADGAKWNWAIATELCPFAIQILDLMHAIQNGTDCGKVLLGDGDAALGLWQQRITQLINGDSPDAAIRELMDCLPLVDSAEQLSALNQLVGYYRDNDKRMRYRTFLEMGLPIGSGIVESAHRHVLQIRMKRAGQRWSIKRARSMAYLRALYRTAGPHHFHSAIRDALKTRPIRANQTLPNGPRRAHRRYQPSQAASI